MMESVILGRLDQLVASDNIKRVEIYANASGYLVDQLSGMGWYTLLVDAILEKKRGILGSKYRKRETMREKFQSCQSSDFIHKSGILLKGIKRYLKNLPKEVEVVGLEKL